MVNSPSQEMRSDFCHGRVRVVIGDITDERVDALVNAANSTLLGGGGVDGAIHARGGAKILAECRELRRTRYPAGLPVGEAVITTAGNLPARYVIHTVGPIYGRPGGRAAELLSACYHQALKLAVEHELTSIAFPAISTGAYRYPRAEAAAVSSEAIAHFLAVDNSLTEVRLVFFLPRDAQTFLNNHKFKE